MGESAREKKGGLVRQGAQPFAAQPVAKDVGQKQGPALVDSPLLRDGVKAAQGIADVRDCLHERLPVFVLQTDFDGLLTAVPDQPCDSSQQRWPTGDRLPVMGAIVE